MKKRWKLLLRCAFLAVIAVLIFGCTSASAATKTGFVTKNGKTYYINKDGSKQKGWLKLNGKKYYFDKKTGVQLKGWAKDANGKNIRYFTKGAGYMVTGYLTDSKGNVRHFDKSSGLMTRGWMTDSEGHKYYFYSGSGVMAKGWVENNKKQKRYFSQSNGRMCTGWVESSTGNYRYFNLSNGIMYTGLKKIDGDYYYFSKTSGVRYQKGFGTTGGKKYYFDPETGKAKIGWLTLGNKKYYFNETGVMMAGTTASIDGKTYKFAEDGTATETKVVYDYTVEGDYIKVLDPNYNKYFYLRKEFASHPGVADGTLSDLDLLAALCESEAGDQGLVGMEAVALCVLNRTIDVNKGFPSEIRYVIYQSKPLQYAVVMDGALLKRLNGQFEDRTSAYKAAQNAIDMFQAYRLNGTPRKLEGFAKKDFDYKYFMMENTFWKQNLSFDKMTLNKDYEVYKDHAFFVDWV